MTTVAATDPHLDGLLPRQSERCQVMGILNVTPDSFSDGGRFFDIDSAVEQGHQLVADGADLLDVGGESTRPGAQRVSEAEELERVIPVVRRLAQDGLPVSVDTMRASVAREAVLAGAVMVNDVSGGLADPGMLPLNRPGFRGGSITWIRPRRGRVFQGSARARCWPSGWSRTRRAG